MFCGPAPVSVSVPGAKTDNAPVVALIEYKDKVSAPAFEA